MRLIAPEDLFSFTLVGDVQIMPDNQHIAYVAQTEDKEKNEKISRIMSAVLGEQPSALTAGPSDTFPRFSPDGKWMGFLSKRSGQRQIWLLPLSGGEARPLTTIDGGVEEFVWAPDSQTVYATANLDEHGIQPEPAHKPEDPPEKKFTADVKVITELFHKMDGVGFFTKRRPHIVSCPINGDAPTQLTHGPYQHNSLAVAPSGEFLVFASRYGKDYDRYAFQQMIYRLDLKNPDQVEAVSPEDLSAEHPIVSPDNQLVYYIAERLDDLGYDTPSLYSTDLQNKATSRLTDQWDRPIGDASIGDMMSPS
ncbi:MAG: S9 family peptidase, partial [Firmicutes bacterium]|nr:S9 family peptidase [Bacillota bacterium]